MAKRDKYNPDYQKLYPNVEISAEVMKVLVQSDRKMKYLEVEIKHGTFLQDSAEFVPTREDSLDRLIDEGKMDFPSLEQTPEEIAIQHDEIDQLSSALKKLNPEDFALIHALFFEGITEREYAKRTGTPYMTIHNKKVRIQEKLKKLLEN